MQRFVTAFKLASVTTLLVLLFSIAGRTVSAVSTTLVINEIDYDMIGADNAEYLELKNVSASPINLDSFSVIYFNAATSSSYRTLDLPNVELAAGDYYVICANMATVANCDLDSGTPDTDHIQNGTPDAIGLWLSSTLVDAVSYEGDSAAPYTEGTGTSAADSNTVAGSIGRCPDGVDTDNNDDDFEFLGTITPGASNCIQEDEAPAVESTTPADNATEVAVDADIEITFSEAVDVTGSWYTIECDLSGTHTAAATGGPTTYTLNPDADFAEGESCTVTVVAAQVSDQDGDDPPDTMAADYEFSFATVGGAVTPQLVITEIMYDPNSPEDDWEWFEVYNAGGTAVNLAGYVVDDNNSVFHTTANIATGSIPAGEAAVLYNADDLDTAEFSAAWGDGINLVAVTNWTALTLNNTGDQLGIWDSFASYSGDHTTHANALHTLTFNAGLGFPDPAGASIYLTDLNADNSVGSNWGTSSNGGSTPLGVGYTSKAAAGNTGADVGSPQGVFPPELLLTELVVAPTGGEFIEIYNPTAGTIDLSDVYLTDATFTGTPSTYYYNIVTGINAGGGSFGDFHARFPDGATIAAGEYQTVGLTGATNFNTEYGVNPTYELFNVDAGVPDMREAFAGSINNQGGLSNDGEVVILYYWNGSSDLVQDLDYVVWGDKVEAVDKSGVSIDGPDAGTETSTYLDDTAVASQDVVGTTHTTDNSWQRDDLTEGTETKTGGNGSTGHNETSENLSETWCDDTPTPNAASDCPIIPPSSCGDPATLISFIQDNDLRSDEVGNVHTIEGIVVADFQGDGVPPSELNGFFVQEEDEDADADPLTSEGIFVFDGSAPAVDVEIGDLVRVTGTVAEFDSTTPTPEEEDDLTELVNVTVAVCSSDNMLPVVTEIELPLASLTFLERYEGMYVTFPQELSVTETFTLGRFGEVLLSSGGVLPHPTQVQEPGPDANAQAAANDLNQILLDDGYTTQNPDPVIFPDPALSASNTLRGGDTVTGLYGAMHFAFGVYRVQPVGTVDFDHDNPRPATSPAVGGTLKVAAFNVLNYFNGDGLGGGFPTSRGAETLFEFDRQRTKIITALLEIDADVVGLMEIENDPTPNSAIEDLVEGLNDNSAPGTYSFIDTGVIGTDEIKVALIYKPGSVMPIGGFEILDSTDDPRFIDTLNRPMLVQTFEENSSGELFTVAVNHLKSKGSDCNAIGDPDTGDEQGNCNLTRTAAAEAIVDYLETDPTDSDDPDFLIIGDLNSYAMEDPIAALEAGGYTNLLADFNGVEEHTYVFDGEWGNLDHALANSSLAAQVTGTASYHINADEPPVLDYNTNFKTPGQIISFYAPDEFRASDHDAVIVGLSLSSAPETGSITITKVVNGTAPGSDWSFSGDLGNFTLPAAGGSTTFTGKSPGSYTITETADPNYTTSVSCDSGENGSSSVSINLEAGEEVTCTFTNTEIVTPDDVLVYVSTEENGTVGSVSFTSQDILLYDGTEWSLFFDGSDYGLNNRHKINVTHINAADDLYLNFEHNAVNVPGVGNVKGWDILYFDGSALSLAFEGSDVALNGSNERIDALHILDGDVSPIGSGCQAYFLISTVGSGNVPVFGGGAVRFSGEDVLGFCATSLGSTTTGHWHMVLDGSAEGMPKNATYSLSASDDGQVLYFTTKDNFNVDSASGSHSEVYRYDFSSGEFSGPVFSAPATGLLQKVTGLHIVGELTAP